MQVFALFASFIGLTVFLMVVAGILVVHNVMGGILA